RVKYIYSPFKHKKITRATEAKHLVLVPLADIFLADKHLDIETAAADYLNEKVTSAEEAIKGALDIIAEIVSDYPQYRLYILKIIKDTSDIVSAVKKNADDEQGVFEMYYDYAEKIKNIVPHRVLALNRGETLKVLTVKMNHDT